MIIGIIRIDISQNNKSVDKAGFPRPSHTVLMKVCLGLCSHGSMSMVWQIW